LKVLLLFLSFPAIDLVLASTYCVSHILIYMVSDHSPDKHTRIDEDKDGWSTTFPHKNHWSHSQGAALPPFSVLVHNRECSPSPSQPDN
jgi:hypothetical protein